MKRKSALLTRTESPSLTKEESCYEHLKRCFYERAEEHCKSGARSPAPPIGRKPLLPPMLEDVQLAAQECPGTFRLEDVHGATLLHHACYSHHVTVEILGEFHEANPDAFDQPSGSGEESRRPVECMTFNTKAPLDAFQFLMEKAKPVRDPYDFYLELRFLCKNEKMPAKASELRRVIEACPEAVSMTFRPNQWGQQISETLLHLLCSNGSATLEAVSYLCEVYPDAISTESIMGHPLHDACACGVSSEIILFLVEQNPDALQEINRYGTPLHRYLDAGVHRVQYDWTGKDRQTDGECIWELSGLDAEVVRCFIDIFPQALQIVPGEVDRGTPLHIMAKMFCRRGCDFSVATGLFQEMVRASPTVLQVQRDRIYPLVHDICMRSDPPTSLIKALVDSDPSLLSLAVVGARLLPIHALCKTWSKSTPIELLEYIVDCAPDTAVAASEDGSLPIHLLLSEHGDISLEAVKVLVECNPGMLHVSLDNGRGLPIHLACRKYAFKETKLKTKLDIIRYLVSKHPASTKARTSLGTSPLDCAIGIRDENTSIIDFLLEEDPEVAKESWGSHKATSFHIACKNGSFETIKKIHELYPNLIQQPDENWGLPLLYAISGCQSRSILAFLIQAFPNSIASKTRDGLLPLHVACRAENPDVWLVEILVKIYPDAIHTATNDGRYPMQFLCDNPDLQHRGLDVLTFLACQLPYSIGRRDAQGRNALHLFCQHRWADGFDNSAAKETLTKLHELYPDAIRQNSDEVGLPIHCACKAGSNLDFLQQLIELYPESIDHSHESLGLPLHCSIGPIGDMGTIEFLLEKRYNSYIEKHGRFLLHAMLEDETIDRKEDLANALFDSIERREQHESFLRMSSFKRRKEPHIAESKDYLGRLPMHIAVSVDLEAEFIRKLVGVHPSSLVEKDRDGKVPLHYAFQNGSQTELLDFLIEEKPTAMLLSDNKNCLPFHVGCQHHRVHGFMDNLIGDALYLHDVCNLDINFLCQHIDSNGDLPLHKACIGGNLDCISSLATTYPVALRTRNNCGMFPVFLICQEKGKDKEDFKAREAEFVGTIFELLRQFPEAIYSFAK